MSDFVKQIDQVLDVVSAMVAKRDQVISDLAEFATTYPQFEAHMAILIKRLK